jgi:hypothetical protein
MERFKMSLKNPFKLAEYILLIIGAPLLLIGTIMSIQNLLSVGSIILISHVLLPSLEDWKDKRIGNKSLFLILLIWLTGVFFILIILLLWKWLVNSFKVKGEIDEKLSEFLFKKRKQSVEVMNWRGNMKRSFEKLIQQVLFLVIPQKWLDWGNEVKKEPLNINDFTNIAIVLGMVVLIFFLFSI